MNVYIILIILTDILVMIGMTVHGAHKGFAHLLSRVISLIVAIIVVVQLSGIVNGYEQGSGSGILIGILMLILLGVVYKIIRIVLGSMKLFAKLPVLSGADKVFGAMLGFLEGFAVLYILEYIIRIYLIR